jgi:hypothetical protein
MIEKLKNDSLKHWTKAATTENKSEMATSVLMHMVAELRLAARTSRDLRRDILKIIDDVDHLTMTRARQSVRT